jgi:glutathione S-transferase
MRLFDYAASGNCLKARILIAVLGLPVERVSIDIFAGATLTQSYAALNPVRETPVLALDDGRVLTQSNAILWYLASGTRWLPTERFAQAQVAMWLAFEQERVMGAIGSARFRLLTGRATFEDPMIQARLATARDALDHLERTLAAHPWLTGDEPTIADVSNFAYTHVARDAGLPLDDWPAVDGWCARIRRLPGYPGDLEPYPANARPGAGRSIYD